MQYFGKDISNPPTTPALRRAFFVSRNLLDALLEVDAKVT